MDYFKLGAVLTLKDMLSEKMEGIKGKINGMRNQLKEAGGDVAAFDASMKNLKIGAAFAGSGLVLANGLIAARVESSKLEANIRSLGVSAAETDKIAQQTRIMATEYGLAKETFLTGIYDIKSAVSSLDPAALAGISREVAKLALATKGDFAGLSDLFGVAYSQFKKMYKGMTDENFAKVFANTVSYAANVYKTDGGKMQQAMQSLGASAAAAGVTLEEQSAILGRLQNSMQPGVAGTSYRAFLSNVGTGFAALGMRAADARGKMLSMPDLLQQIKNRFGENLTVQKTDWLKKAFGSEEAVSFIKEILPNIKDLRGEIKTIQDLNKAGNYSFVDEASAANMQNLSQQLDRVGAAWKSFKDLVGKGFGDSFIAPLAGKIADVFLWIQKAAQQNPALQAMLSSLGGIVVGVTTVVGVLMAASAAMKIYNLLMERNAVVSFLMGMAQKAAAIGSIIFGNGMNFASISAGVLKVAQMGLNAVMSINPIFLLITAIAALIVYWDDLKKGYVEMENISKKTGVDMRGALGPVIDGIKLIIDNWEKIKAFFGIKLTAGDQLSIDLKKANNQLDELKKKQELLTTAGQTKLPEYKKVTDEIKAQNDAIEKLKKTESDRAKLDTGLEGITQKIDAMKALAPTADAATKASMDAQVNALSGLRDRIKGALDVGDLNLAQKLGDQSVLQNIEKGGIAIAETIAKGIKKGQPLSDVAMRDLVGSIDKFIPHSDAKEGPLSRLTASGRALVSTFSHGIEVEGRNTDATEKFVNQQARAIKTDSPLMEKLTAGAAAARMSASSIIGNLYLNLSGKDMSREEFSRKLATEFMDILDKAELA